MTLPGSPPQEADRYPVVIIGGGLAGLTAAAHLAAHGVAPLVLDADRLWPGGRLAGGDADTFTYNGQHWSFPTEHGIHALWGGYVNMRATLERFAPIELLPSSGERWINRWGKHVRAVEAGTAVRSRGLAAPFHYLQLLFRPRFWGTIIPLDFVSLPGFLASLLWTVGFDPIEEQSALDGLTLNDYFLGWTPNLRATFTGLAANLLAAPEDSIHLSAFIAALRFYTMMRPEDWTPHFFPRNAHTAVIDPLRASTEANGGRVMSGWTAQRLEPDGTGWRVTAEDGQAGHGLHSFYAEHVILATHAPGASRLLSASPALSDTASRLNIPEAVRTATVRLWFKTDAADPTPSGMFTGDFLPDNYFWLHRIHEEYADWHQQTGGSAIEVHLYVTEKILERPDNALLIQVIDDVQRAFPELRGQYVYGSLRRNSKTHTRWRVPTADSLHVRTPWAGIHACGDWIGYTTPSLWMERACTTAIAAANAVLEASGCEPWPVIPPPRPDRVARAMQTLVHGGRTLFGPAVTSALRTVRGKRSSA